MRFQTMIFLAATAFLFSGCGGGTKSCKMCDCPDDIRMLSAQLEVSESGVCSFPEGVNDLARTTLQCIIDSALGTYENPDGEQLTLSCDPDNKAFFPEDYVPCSCTYWTLPIRIETPTETLSASIGTECHGCGGELLIWEGVLKSLDDPTSGASKLFGDLVHEDGQWTLMIIDNQDVTWTKI